MIYFAVRLGDLHDAIDILWFRIFIYKFEYVIILQYIKKQLYYHIKLWLIKVIFDKELIHTE